ncbi:MAG: hypothetical protein Q6373_025210 [Candidatus Sigynarchaeota archaeon]
MSKDRIIADLGPVFDSHEHFGYFDGYSPAKPERTLKDLINGAYMATGAVDASDYPGICKALAGFVGSDRFQSFRLGMKALYGEDLYPMSPRVAERVDAKVRVAHESGDHAFRILKEHMQVSRAVLDVPPRAWRAWKHGIGNLSCSGETSRAEPGQHDPRRSRNPIGFTGGSSASPRSQPC